MTVHGENKRAERHGLYYHGDTEHKVDSKQKMIIAFDILEQMQKRRCIKPVEGDSGAVDSQGSSSGSVWKLCWNRSVCLSLLLQLFNPYLFLSAVCAK